MPHESSIASIYVGRKRYATKHVGGWMRVIATAGGDLTQRSDSHCGMLVSAWAVTIYLRDARAG